PTRGLAHDIRVTMGGQMHESFVADASSTHDSRLMSSEVPSSSGIEGICDMVPLGLLANAAAPFEIEIEWTHPLEMGADGSSYRLPAVGNAYTRKTALPLNIDADARVLEMLSWHRGALAVDRTRATAQRSDAELGPCMELLLSDSSSTPRSFAGLSPNLDDVFFAAELVRPVSPRGIVSDVMILVVESGSMAGDRQSLARQTALVL